MKKITYFFAALFMLPMLVFAQVNFKIKGNINGLVDGTELFLVYLADNAEKVDSVIVKNGKFLFTGKADKPSFSYIYNSFYPGSGRKLNTDYKRLYIEKGIIRINGKDDLKYSVLSGTRNNSEMQVYDEMIKPVQKEEDSLSTVFRRNLDGKSKDERDKVIKWFNEHMSETKSKINPLKFNYVRNYPDAVLSQSYLPDMISRSENLAFFDSVYNKMSGSTKESEFGKKFYAILQKNHALAVGQPAPDFTQNDENGKPVNFAEFSKGKYVLIDFWASWCYPCREENPNLVKSYEKYQHKGFEIIGVALENGEIAKQAWLAAIEKDGLTWQQVSDFGFWNNEVAKLYNIEFVPFNYLVAPDGKIIAKNLRGERLQKKLAELFD